MMKKSLAVLAASALSVSFAASAANTDAILSAIDGQVMVNQGQQYEAAAENMLLHPGDRLMVMQGGSAQVQFANGCVMALGGNEIATIGSPETCVTQQGAGTYNQVGSTGTGGGGGGGGIDAGGVIFGTIVAGGIIYGISDDKDDNGPPPPASP